MSYTLDYVELPSTDNTATARFLSEAFGWPAVDYGPDYSALEAGGAEMGVDGSAGRATAPLAIIRADDLEAAERAVVAAGGVILRPIYPYPGGRRFHFREPGGNELAVYVEG